MVKAVLVMARKRMRGKSKLRQREDESEKWVGVSCGWCAVDGAMGYVLDGVVGCAVGLWWLCTGLWWLG